MTFEGQEAAAQFLATARKSGRPGARLPEACRPPDLESALVDPASRRRIAGTRPSAAGSARCLRRRGQSTLHRSSPRRSSAKSPCAIAATGHHGENRTRGGVRDGRDLPQRDQPYSEAEIRAAIAEPRLVLEILGSRYADPSVVTLAGNDRGQRAEPGTFHRSDVCECSRYRTSRLRDHRSQRRPVCCPRTTVTMATGIRCIRCTGSRISLRNAARDCAPGRSSRRGPTPARSRFRCMRRSP